MPKLKRVRLEFRVVRTEPQHFEYIPDKKLLLLAAMLQERFGVPGALAIDHWAEQCVALGARRSLVRGVR